MKAERKIALFRFALFAALAAIVAGLTGCQTAHVKCEGDGKWEASINSHWFRRDVDGFKAEVQPGGVFSIDLNGYKSDASEQLPAFTKEMWSGLAILGRIAATTMNPAAASVPLMSEAAKSDDISAILKAKAELEAQTAAAKAELAKARAAASQSSQQSQTSQSNCTDCEVK